MSFLGFMSAPVSVPNVLDTTPCLEHLMEYEDCVIDVGSNKKQLLMPTWPTLWPGLLTGKSGEDIDTRPKEMMFADNYVKDKAADNNALSAR